MKKILLILSFFILNFSNAQVITGQVHHDDMNYQNKIIDTKSGVAIEGAKISIPDLNYSTYSNADGTFRLNADISDKTVMFVEKEGYKVFSLTVDNSVFNSPLKLGIEQASPFDFQITQGVVHLGDNMFSSNSANSKDFELSARGNFLSVTFAKPKYMQNQDVVVKIGTIIGLDTKKAKERGQNKISKVYASATEVYVNGHKIGTLELNGDNIEISIPKNILKITNELVIKTGRNLFQKDYVDYDDIELANVRIEVKEKQFYAKN